MKDQQAFLTATTLIIVGGVRGLAGGLGAQPHGVPGPSTPTWQGCRGIRGDFMRLVGALGDQKW